MSPYRSTDEIDNLTHAPAHTNNNSSNNHNHHHSSHQARTGAGDELLGVHLGDGGVHPVPRQGVLHLGVSGQGERR